ncbi:MAG: DUF5658 family protein [Actinomycetota bacterium]
MEARSTIPPPAADRTSGRDLVIDLRDPRDPRLLDPAEPRPDDRRRGLTLLVVLNGLNLLDAVLTVALVQAGLAYEGNPIVGWLTLPGKLALVGVLSFVLWRLRPRASIVPVVAYALVVCYTLAAALFFS